MQSAFYEHLDEDPRGSLPAAEDAFFDCYISLSPSPPRSILRTSKGSLEALGHGTTSINRGLDGSSEVWGTFASENRRSAPGNAPFLRFRALATQENNRRISDPFFEKSQLKPAVLHEEFFNENRLHIPASPKQFLAPLSRSFSVGSPGRRPTRLSAPVPPQRSSSLNITRLTRRPSSSRSLSITSIKSLREILSQTREPLFLDIRKRNDIELIFPSSFLKSNSTPDRRPSFTSIDSLLRSNSTASTSRRSTPLIYRSTSASSLFCKGSKQAVFVPKFLIDHSKMDSTKHCRSDESAESTQAQAGGSADESKDQLQPLEFSMRDSYKPDFQRNPSRKNRFSSLFRKVSTRVQRNRKSAGFRSDRFSNPFNLTEGPESIGASMVALAPIFGTDAPDLSLALPVDHTTSSIVSPRSSRFLEDLEPLPRMNSVDSLAAKMGHRVSALAKRLSAYFRRDKKNHLSYEEDAVTAEQDSLNESN